MIPVASAEQIIGELVHPLGSGSALDTEVVALNAAYGRVLAQPMSSSLDIPHWDNSAMDGYAVQFADVQTATEAHPVRLTIVADVPAGQKPSHGLQSGQAVRILTGAMLPPGADTVVMQENTQRHGNQVMVVTAPRQLGEFVRSQGAFYRSGDPLLPDGIVLGAPELAILAATQCVVVRVYRRPRVALLSTGNELVTPDQPLQPGQIVDSNQVALAALVKQAGCEPICLGICPDQPQALAAAIAHACTVADVVLSSGGVSVGDYDYVDRILVELGATLHVRSVAIKPGKPLTVATLPPNPHPVLYFGLPGNPVSALVTFWRLVSPALKKLTGRTDGWQPILVTGFTRDLLKADGKRETYLWGRSSLIDGRYHFQSAPGSYSSGNLVNLAHTNALAIVPIGQTQIHPGQSLSILLP